MKTQSVKLVESLVKQEFGNISIPDIWNLNYTELYEFISEFMFENRKLSTNEYVYHIGYSLWQGWVEQHYLTGGTTSREIADSILYKLGHFTLDIS